MPADEAGLDALLVHPAQAPVLVACTTREPGRSNGAFARNNLALHVGDAQPAVEANREMLLQALGARHIQWLEQVHGVECVHASAKSALHTPAADAMWTAQPGLALAVLTADCVPVLVWSSDGAVAGAAHAGWRGLRDGVIDALLDALPLPGGELAAWIGPCISAPHYEVGEDVWSQFGADDPRRVLERPGDASKRLLDLAGLAYDRLTRRGVSAIQNSGLCTYSDPRFYSYRRARRHDDAETGRIASVVMIKQRARVK